MPYPSAPLPDTVSASGSCRILRSPCPVWCSGAGAGTPLCDSERTEGGGNPSEEPGEEGEADDPGPEPAKASASVVGGGGGPAAPPSRSAYSPRPRPWQPGEEAAIVSEPAPERGAQRREIPGKEAAATGAVRARGAESGRRGALGSCGGERRRPLPGQLSRDPRSTVSVPGEDSGGGRCGRNGGAGAAVGGARGARRGGGGVASELCAELAGAGDGGYCGP